MKTTLSSCILVAAFAFTSLAACESSTPKPDPTVTPKPVAASPEGESEGDVVGAASTLCAFDSAWLTPGALPSEVSGPTQCDFHKFMWHAFSQLVQPSGTSGKLLLETWMPTYGIFVADGQSPTAWGTTPANPCSSQGDGEALLFSGITKQAGVMQPLIDQQGNNVYYGVSLNKTAYDFVTSCELYKYGCGAQLGRNDAGVDLIKKYPNLAFPDGSAELKTAWKVMTTAEAAGGSFYTIKGLIQPNSAAPTVCEEKTLGLVGLHIVLKTPDHPEFVWGTFEQRNNAPDCETLSASPASGSWTFFDETTYKACKTEHCTNTYVPGVATQVCREHPYGDSNSGAYPNGNNCSVTPNQRICQPDVQAALQKNTAAMKSINTSAATAFSSQAAFKVWAGYELTGNIWTSDGTPAGKGVLPPSQRAWAGSLSSANITMETYVQNGQAGVINPASCFTCHSMVSGDGAPDLPPAGLSHIFHELVPGGGGCSDGNLPATCNGGS